MKVNGQPRRSIEAAPPARWASVSGFITEHGIAAANETALRRHGPSRAA